MKSKLLLVIFLLAIGGSASAQLVLPICSVNLPCPGFPLGSVQAPIDQNGWRNFKVTLTSNVTSFSFVGIPPSPAQASVNIIFTEDGIGGRTVTFASSITNPCTITTIANTTTLCQFEYDGTVGTWFGISGGSGGGAVADPRTSTQILPLNWEGAIPQGAGSGTVAFSAAATPIQSANCTTAQTLTIAIGAGTTPIVFVTNEGNSTGGVMVQFFVWDDGGNIYKQLVTGGNPASGGLQMWTVPPSSALPASHVFILQTSSPLGCVAGAATYTGVKSFGNTSMTNATSTSVSLSQVTQDPSNLLTCGAEWNVPATTFTATSGTARANLASTSGFMGMVVGDNTTANPSSVTFSGTLSNSVFWQEECVELRSFAGVTGTWGIIGPNNISALSGASIVGAGAQALSLQTSTQSGSHATISSPANLIPQVSYANTAFDTWFRVQFGSASTTNVAAFVGMSDLTGPGEFAENFTGFCFNTGLTSADTTWNYCTRSGGGPVVRSASSLSAIDSAWHDLRVRATPGVPGSFNFSVDNGIETAINTNIPIANMGLQASVFTLTTTNKALFLVPPYHIVSVSK